MSNYLRIISTTMTTSRTMDNLTGSKRAIDSVFSPFKGKPTRESKVDFNFFLEVSYSVLIMK